VGLRPQESNRPLATVLKSPSLSSDLAVSGDRFSIPMERDSHMSPRRHMMNAITGHNNQNTGATG
jgi:hypothetical protein